MKLAICGDSWFCKDKDFPGKSFGEIVANQHGIDLISLARAGSSNFAIALQIDKAIELGADAVILGTTSIVRMDIPAGRNSHSLSPQLDHDSELNESYDKLRGISNIDYDKWKHFDNQFDFLKDPTIHSNVMHNFLIGTPYSSREKTEALKHYVAHLYDSGIKRQMDSWIISDACRRLQQAEIPFLVFVESLLKIHTDINKERDWLVDFAWLPEYNVVKAIDFSTFADLPITNNATFHYCKDTGGKIFAEFVVQRFNQFCSIFKQESL